MVRCGLVSAASIVMCLVAACSDSGSSGKGVAGGTSEDAGVVAIKNMEVAGVSQKGPFIKGSAVTVHSLRIRSDKRSAPFSQI